MNFRLVLLACLLASLSCGEDSGLFAPAGKAAVAGPFQVVSWACDDSTAAWTVFYGTHVRFLVQGSRVQLTEYGDAGQSLRYWTSEESLEDRHRTIFRRDDGTCGLWSEPIIAPDVVRIWQGKIEYWHWGTESAAYYLLEDNGTFLIAHIDSAAARYTDWHDLWHRDQAHPEAAMNFRWREYRGYVLPVNFDQDAFERDFRHSTERLRDDRRYLLDPLCSTDGECAGWADVISPPVPEPVIETPEPVIEVRERPRRPSGGSSSPPPRRGPVTRPTTTTTEVVEEEEEETIDPPPPACVPDPVYVYITGGDNINAGTKALRWTWISGAVGNQLLECKNRTQIRNCRTRLGYSVSGVSEYQAEWVEIDNNGRCGPINPFEKVKVTFTNSCGNEQTVWSHCTKRSAGNSLWCDQAEVFENALSDRGPCSSLGATKRI